MTPPANTGQQAAQPFVLAHPLDDFYALAGESLPPLQQIDGEEVPQPYKQLLVHQDDMTPTLEKFHKHNIHLRVLGRRQMDDAYYREVALLLDETNEPVEFGAIKINLDRFSPEARQHILAESRPLGTILGQDGITHTSHPKAFIRVASDKIINEALELHGAHIMFGRRNTLFDPEGMPLAEIVEILPPSPRPK